ncbi:MAG: hypothetical protein CVT89_03385 [Candidatus Altiarchaeales archaeon HGW-Altiarchaeales-2]|nr:MAG: hypothetical protein CVT89_03385 [Candidatus Altiarchaeales archaeon HGW-Altiarchaeales-2]
MKAVILAGGKGTMLRPSTYLIPKHLMPIGEQPITEIELNELGVEVYFDSGKVIKRVAELVE